MGGKSYYVSSAFIVTLTVQSFTYLCTTKTSSQQKTLQPRAFVDEDLYGLTYIKCDAVVRPTLNEVVLDDVAKTDTRPFIQNRLVKMHYDLSDLLHQQQILHL